MILVQCQMWNQNQWMAFVQTVRLKSNYSELFIDIFCLPQSFHLPAAVFVVLPKPPKPVLGADEVNPPNSAPPVLAGAPNNDVG